jgi:hypothetical protein|tara:strand:+ start:1052 stop:1507 length:456 start_codon:yes stop_codon:yes gene_type:complete
MAGLEALLGGLAGVGEGSQKAFGETVKSRRDEEAAREQGLRDLIKAISTKSLEKDTKPIHLESLGEELGNIGQSPQGASGDFNPQKSSNDFGLRLNSLYGKGGGNLLRAILTGIISPTPTTTSRAIRDPFDPNAGTANVKKPKVLDLSQFE